MWGGEDHQTREAASAIDGRVVHVWPLGAVLEVEARELWVVKEIALLASRSNATLEVASGHWPVRSVLQSTHVGLVGLLQLGDQLHLFAGVRVGPVVSGGAISTVSHV